MASSDTQAVHRTHQFMPMTHVPEAGAENPYQKTGTIFRTQFFVPDETGSKISGLIFLYYTVPPIHFKAIKQQTTQLI